VNAAERRAALHYRLRGYRILATNAWAGGNEVDVIARRGRTVVFCEVKERRRDDFGAPEEFVHPEKQRRVRRAAAAWLAGRPDLSELDVRFDVVAVADGRLKRISGVF
jgi:putative endonuclease